MQKESNDWQRQNWNVENNIITIKDIYTLFSPWKKNTNQHSSGVSNLGCKLGSGLASTMCGEVL